MWGLVAGAIISAVASGFASTRKPQANPSDQANADLLNQALARRTKFREGRAYRQGIASGVMRGYSSTRGGSSVGVTPMAPEAGIGMDVSMVPEGDLSTQDPLNRLKAFPYEG